MKFSLGLHDLALIIAVSFQAALLTYLREPRWKAIILSLPIPFTMAALSVARPVGATNVLGLTLLFLYAQGVRLLNHQWRVPIVPAIALSAGGYILLGSLLARVVPDTEGAFWGSCAATVGLGIWLFWRMPPRNETPYRSPLPLWIKLPILAAVILFLLTLKNVLQGFMTIFPMMGVLGAYEARHSLWTISRQMPVVMFTLAPMMAVCRLTQHHLGLAPAMVLAWVVFLTIFLPLMWADFRRSPAKSEPDVQAARS